MQSLVYTEQADLIALIAQRADDRVIVVQDVPTALDALARIELLASAALCLSSDSNVALDVGTQVLTQWPRVPCVPWTLRRARSRPAPHLLGIVAHDVRDAGTAVELVLELDRTARVRRRVQRAAAEIAAGRVSMTAKQRIFVELVAMDVPDEDMHIWLRQSRDTYRVFRSEVYQRMRIMDGFAGLQACLRNALVDVLVGQATSVPWLVNDLGDRQHIQPLLNECARG